MSHAPPVNKPLRLHLKNRIMIRPSLTTHRYCPAPGSCHFHPDDDRASSRAPFALPFLLPQVCPQEGSQSGSLLHELPQSTMSSDIHTCVPCRGDSGLGSVTSNTRGKQELRKRVNFGNAAATLEGSPTGRSLLEDGRPRGKGGPDVLAEPSPPAE